MSVVVQKYGGSSVADLDKLRRVADRVVATRDAGHDVVVVVSAMGKTTGNLLQLAEEAARPPAGPEEEAEPPRRELDMLVSTGERVSMALLSIAIRARGRAAISFTGSQSGIITNDRHFDARIIEVRPHRIEDELARGQVVIVAGYQGMSYKREITTLGRGGSDTTAVALAAALDADRCEIYSDVDGVYTADPRNVADARHLPELSYETLQEMAEAGAKVVNAQAVEWARKNKVTLYARRTGDVAGPGGEPARQTVVSDRAAGARAVAVQKDLALIRARAVRQRELLDLAREHCLPLRDLTVAGGTVTACAPLTNVPDWPKVRSILAGVGRDGLEVLDGLASVSLVGVEVGSDPATVVRALACVATGPEWIVCSPLRVSCVVAAGDAGALERSWHEAFVS